MVPQYLVVEDQVLQLAALVGRLGGDVGHVFLLTFAHPRFHYRH